MGLDASETVFPKEQRRRSWTTSNIQKDDGHLLDVSKGQLEVRYKRYHEQFATVHELLQKVAISVSRLESENNSLREQNEYLLKKCGLNRDNRKFTTNAPSAARAAVDLAVQTVQNMQAKLVDFEKVALSQRTLSDEAKQENREMKATLEEVKKNLQQEQKKTVHFQERLNFMENEYVKEATMRLAAERRLCSLQKEVQDLADELSAAQCSQHTDHNLQQSSDGTDHASPVSGNVVITSTPHVHSTYRTGTGKSFRNFTCILRTTPHTANKFQNALSNIGERLNKLRNKLKTFVESGKSFQAIQNDVVESIKKMFKSKPPKMPMDSMDFSNYIELMAKSTLD